MAFRRGRLDLCGTKPNRQNGREVPLYPLKFRPILVRRVWGGRRLAAWGKRLPPGERIGESWELCDRPDSQSIVGCGPLEGCSLHELMTERRSELLGAKLSGRFPDAFPLLIKLIHARQDLSIQVHPDDRAARRLSGEPSGKAEAWYIVEARPGASIILGLRPGTSRRELEQAALGGRVPELVRRLHVRPGDVLFVPPGTVHHLGKGIVLVEVQQNSDLTYRLYDWGRRGEERRELHVREALSSIHFGAAPPRVRRGTTARRQSLVRCRSFAIDLCRGSFEESIEEFRGLSVLRGRGRILYGKALKESCPIRRGETVLVPAALRRYRVDGPTTLQTLLWWIW